MNEYVIPQEMIDRLQKGSEIFRSEIEPLLPKHDGEDEYRLHLMTWASRLQKALRKAGKPCTLRTRDMGRRVVVLTDEQATAHNRKHFAGYLRRASHRHDRMQEVDVTNLNPDQQRTHERSVCVQAAIMSSITETKREFSPTSHRRRTPSLITTEA